MFDADYWYFCTLFPLEPHQMRRSVLKAIQGLVENTRSGTMTTISKSFPSVLKIFKGKESYCRPLPDDVLLEVLRRLAPEHILICRVVCKRWMSLTSTPLFLGLQLKPAPVILLQHYLQYSELKLYYLDLTPDEPRIGRFDITKLRPNNRRCYYGGTCNGLVLLFRHESFGTFHVSICNPLTGKELTLPATKADYYLGFWYHPIKREYFFLTYSNGAKGEGQLRHRGFEYKVFSLRGECTVIGWYDALPTTKLPINISGSLYFLIHGEGSSSNPRNCIMIFNVESEKMDFKAHPHYEHCYSPGHGRDNVDMCLLDVEGSLGFAHLCSTEHSLQLWVLADYATWKWIPRYKINTTWHSSMGRICVLSVLQNSELLMHFCYRSLFAFNLETRRIRKINISVDGPESGIGAAGTHVSTLVDPHCLVTLS